MGVGAERPHEIDEVEGVILDVELARRHGDVAGVVPVGDIDIRIGQQRGDGGPQQRRVMARHRRDQQHLAGHRRTAADEELHQIAEGLFNHGLDVHQMVGAVRPDDGADAPVRFRHHAAEGAFRHLAPGRHQRQRRVHRHGEGGIGCHRPCRGAQPLVRVAGCFHHVVGEHVTHVTSPCPGGPNPAFTAFPPGPAAICCIAARIGGKYSHDNGRQRRK